MVSLLRREKITWSVAGFVFLLLLLTFLCEDSLIFKVTRRGTLANINFDDSASEKDLSRIKTFVETNDSPFKDVTISFKINVRSITEYNNAFQTAPGNDGIRLEVSKPFTLGVVVGHEWPEDHKGFLLTRSLELGKWYSVSIDITRSKWVTIRLNERVVVHSFEPRIHYQVSDMAVGTGFSKTRPFFGAVSDFYMKYRFFKKNYEMERALLMAKIVLLSGLVCLVLLALSRRQGGLGGTTRIELSAIVILVGFVFSVFYHYIVGVYYEFPYPFNTFLSNPLSRVPYLLSSYRGESLMESSIDDGTGSVSSTFRLAISLFVPLIGFIYYNYRSAVQTVEQSLGKVEIWTQVFIVSFLTYPFLLIMDRGSDDLCVFILLVLFVYFYLQKNSYLSAAILAAASAVSEYPSLFLMIFIADKKYKECLVSLLLGAGLIAIGHLIVGRSLSQWYVLTFHDYAGLMQASPRVLLSFSSNLAAVFALFGTLINPFWTEARLIPWLWPAQFLVLLLTYCLVKVEPEFWKRLLLVVIATILLSQGSSDYRLLMILLPFWLFAKSENLQSTDTFYATAMALLLVPKAYVITYQGADLGEPFYGTIGSVLNPVIMMLILARNISESAVSTRLIRLTPAWRRRPVNSDKARLGPD